MLRELRKKNKPVVVVVTSGSAVDIAAIEPYADAIILVWCPGEQGGNALADILFGKVSPSGRLPVTFYRSLADLPAYDNYSMQGRTYRYFDGPVLYPFGFGLSYTSFAYDWEKKPIHTKASNDKLSFSVSLTNTGNFAGEEVAQAYVQYPSGERMPLKELKGFKRVFVQKGKKSTVSFSIPLAELQKWDRAQSKWILHPGTYTLILGGSSADARLKATINISGDS